MYVYMYTYICIKDPCQVMFEYFTRNLCICVYSIFDTHTVLVQYVQDTWTLCICIYSIYTHTVLVTYVTSHSQSHLG